MPVLYGTGRDSFCEWRSPEHARVRSDLQLFTPLRNEAITPQVAVLVWEVCH
jgi:hypothetical protein